MVTTARRTWSSQPWRRRPAAPLAAHLAAAVAGLAMVGAGLVAAGPATAADVTFTIVAMSDTQKEVDSGNPLMANRYQWIADNKASKAIAFVAHTGDVVNWGVADPAQFTRADTATKILDASGIPYTLAVGNHDTAAVTVGGSAAPGDVRANLRNTAKFNQTFPLSRFRNVGGVYEAGKSNNMYQTFSAGGKQWLVLTLEMWPRTAVITWAQNVLAANPNHNVIIATHANIDANGARPTTGMFGDNSAQVLWDRLGSQYANVRIILSGHYGPKDGSLGAAYKTVTGVRGNKVLQVMTAYTALHQNHLRTLTINTTAMSVTSGVLVPLSTNRAYPSGKITDAASDFTVTGMNFLPPAGAPAAPAALSGTATCAAGLANLTGTAGPGHLIQIRDAAWVIRAKANADAAGKWSAAKVAGLCQVGGKNNVILEEANAGKRVAVVTISATEAAGATLTATVTSRNAATGAISLTGTAQPGHLLQIRDAAWVIKAKVYADAGGKWSATSIAGLVPAGKAGQIIIEEAAGGQRVAVITVNVA